MDRSLEAWCSDEHAGTLTHTATGLRFVYAKKWLASARAPISQCLPLNGSFGDADVEAFFGGLLPEGEHREQLAQLLGVSETNTFGLLEALGGDTAGALSLYPPGGSPPPRGREVEWLDDSALERVLDELPDRPMHADEDGEYRLSLAGVHDKLPVVVNEQGRIGLTKGRTPSTHILKTPITTLRDTVANEAMCPMIGLALGIQTIDATPRRVGNHEFLLVKRYDRAQTPAGARRLHQEDFCQALAVPPGRKYQAEGGPSLADCFALLRRATSVPATETIGFLDYVFLSFLIGNHDAHGKNYSLLYLPSQPTTALAPAYDLLSTVAYSRWRKMSRKMAMSIGGEYRADYVRRRHLERMLGQAELGAAQTRRRLRRLAEQAPAAAREARARLVAEGWGSEVLDEIVKVVEARSRALAGIAESPPTPNEAGFAPVEGQDRRAGFLDTMAAAEARQHELPLALEAIAEGVRGVGDLATTTTTRLHESDEAGRGMRGRLDVISSYASELNAIADRLEPEVERYLGAFGPYIEAVDSVVRTMERDPAARQEGAQAATAVRSLAVTTRQARDNLAGLLGSIEQGAGSAHVLRAPSRRLVVLLRQFLDATFAIEELDERVAALDFGVGPTLPLGAATD
jgi:serine/threonine-protein kinase HipA